jgi:4'-phosphopantetheinyl transferase
MIFYLLRRKEMRWYIPEIFPTLTEEQAHIWLTEISGHLNRIAYLEAILSDQELERARRFVKRSLYERFVIVRGLLKLLLAKYLNFRAKDVVINYSAYGKPYLNERIQFNISHSNDMAVFAFTNNIPVGIDIEFKRNFKELEAICRRYFSENEQLEVCSKSREDRLETFYKIWVRKEAFVKTMGSSIFQVLEARSNLERIEKGISICPFFAHDAYVAALAVKARNIGVEYWHLPSNSSKSLFKVF